MSTSTRNRIPSDPPSSYRAIENLIATYAELVDDGDFAGVGILLERAEGSAGPAEARDNVTGEQLDLGGRHVHRPEHERVEAVVHEPGERLHPPVGPHPRCALLGAGTGSARGWPPADGNNHQIDRINAEAKAREVNVTVLVDFVHVSEYLWKAGWTFHKEGDPAAELWVRRHAQSILRGNATKVAGAIKRQATKAGLEPPQRVGADTCAAYLTNKQDYLDYPTALNNGWPIATGVIEGACRHLVKDRLDITGARRGLDGAEAILKLRAIRSNGDFDQYWQYHLAQEQQRIHQSRYANNIIPRQT